MRIFKDTGKMSTFGGPLDTGVKWNEGLAYVRESDLERDFRLRDLFLKQQPRGTSGLARRLDPKKFYCAMRFPETHAWYERVRNSMVRVTNEAGKSILCVPADWGPNLDTGRIIDLSTGAAAALGVVTDRDIVTAELIPLSAIAPQALS